ncbi:MAG: hypothetical protein JW934_12750 [Anaerolineae bacterium]|nr:hypothetical protein [Anaerolineae bacterium]
MDQTNNPLLIALVGPTGVGKTALAIVITVQLGGEIVSVCRGLRRR